MKEGFNMKRKFLSIVSLFLAVMMILPMGVFVYADETGDTPSEITDIQVFDADGKAVSEFSGIFFGEQTVKLTAQGGDGKTYKWLSDDTTVLSVSGNGSTATVTVKSAGNANVVVTSADRSATVAFKISDDEIESVTAKLKAGKSNEYVSGQTFDKSTLEVTYKMKSGKGDTVDGSDSSVTTNVDNRTLTTADTYVTVSYKGKPAKDNVSIKVSEKSVETVDIDYMKKQDFTEGEGLPEMKVKVTYNDNTDMTLVDGFDIYLGDDTTPLKGSYTFKLEDNGKSIYVKFNGVSSSSRTITVTKKNNDPVTDDSYSIEMIKAPTKTEYRVGDKFSPTGMTVKVYQKVNGNNVELTSSDVIVRYSEYTITDTDLKNKTYITVPVTLTMKTGTNAGKSYKVDLKVTGLTIKDAAGELSVYEITDVEMVENSYPVGYKFAVDDVDYFKYKEKGGRTEYKVSGYDMLHSYTNNFDLEVLPNKYDKPTVKSSRYMYTLEEGDIFTDTKRDTQYAYLRLTVDKETYDFTIKVGGSGVYYYYDSDLIETYDDIDYAIKYTMEQDKNVKDKFDLDRVKDSKDITLKLGEDQKVSTKTDFELCHNVTIDLAGHKLDFYTDTVDIIKANRDYTLTITNTSSTSAKFTYVDEEVEITLAKGDKIVFEYDKDIPGIYTITLDIDTNGKVTTTPAAGKNDTVKVGQGSDIKFTITPSTDYELDTIKLDTKTVSEKDYTKSSTGVVTYTLKSVAKSQKVTVTFKKSNTTKNWNNPFTDVSATDSYYSAVKFVYENNLFKGTTTTKFGPDTTMTRAMFVTVLGRLAGVDVSRFKTSSYSDVPINATTTWYAPYVEWATSINASDAEEVADWAKDAVKYASQQNFLVKVGTSSRINPTGEAKRSELAQLLEKYCDVVLDWNSSNK